MKSKSKLGRRNRQKGQEYERKIAKVLNEEMKWNLVRNLEQSRRDLHGDLVDEQTHQGPYEGQVFLECKNRKEAIVWPELFAQKGALYAWIEEAYEKVDGKELWIFFKAGRYDFVAVVNGNSPRFFSDGVLSLPDLQISTLAAFLIYYRNEGHNDNK